jgi:hypothetical protein
MDGSEQGEDDFEVVPVQEDDGMQWDVEDEDQDEIKREKIQSKHKRPSHAYRHELTCSFL